MDATTRAAAFSTARRRVARYSTIALLWVAVAGVTPSVWFTASSGHGAAAAALLTFVAAAVLTPLLVRRSHWEKERDQLLHELARTARLDPLTGLLNRTALTDRLEIVLHRARRTRNDAAVLFVDLDGFKKVNDTLGHAAGDAYLTAVATSLRASLRHGDALGRLGGDEFVVLVDDLEPGSDVEAFCDRVRDAVDDASQRAAADLGGPRVGASVGVARLCHHLLGRTAPEGVAALAQDLLRAADRSMYEAKAARART